MKIVFGSLLYKLISKRIFFIPLTNLSGDKPLLLSDHPKSLTKLYRPRLQDLKAAVCGILIENIVALQGAKDKDNLLPKCSRVSSVLAWIVVGNDSCKDMKHTCIKHHPRHVHDLDVANEVK